MAKGESSRLVEAIFDAYRSVPALSDRMVRNEWLDAAINCGRCRECGKAVLEHTWSVAALDRVQILADAP